MTGPEVRYAEHSGISIAYQVLGDGPRDLLFVCGTMSHLALWSSDPLARAMLDGLARFSRVILFDKPGTGMSDPLPAAPTLEQRTADLVAVLDAAGSERAVVVGYSEGGLPSVVLAATQPARVEALVLVDTLMAMDWQPDMVSTREEYDRAWAVLDAASARWGAGLLTSAMAPTWVADPIYRPALPAIEQACMSPRMARSVLQGYHGMDAREAAAAVHVPTLVLHCVDDRLVPHSCGRDAARRIPGAVLQDLRGPDHFVWIHNSAAIPDAIEQFVTGHAPSPRDDDRILTTVVFTDIVDSTRRLSDQGDQAWRAVLADHDELVDDLLRRLGGHSVKHTGDGRLAHFARPARAVRFAAALCDQAARSGVQVRAGVHTGECELLGDDLIGLAVNIAARVTAVAGPSEVLVSSTVRDLVTGSGLAFSSAGSHELKGAPGSWALYRYERDHPGPLASRGYETDVRHVEEQPGHV